MGRIFGAIIVQFQGFFKALPPLKRNILVLSATVAVVALLIVGALLGKKDYVPLFTNVATDQLPLILSNLQGKNIPFKMNDNNGTILVPRELLPATQMAIMEELGSNKVGSMGLELFEKQDFGVTSYAQRIQYQRAIQGELMRSINTLSAIRQSKVLLAMPSKKTFLEEGADPSASVVIELQPEKYFQKIRFVGSLTW